LVRDLCFQDERIAGFAIPEEKILSFLKDENPLFARLIFSSIFYHDKWEVLC
jgi:hypothetical protein